MESLKKTHLLNVRAIRRRFEQEPRAQRLEEFINFEKEDALSKKQIEELRDILENEFQEWDTKLSNLLR